MKGKAKVKHVSRKRIAEMLGYLREENLTEVDPHEPDCPCYGDSTPDGAAVIHSVDCKSCSCNAKARDESESPVSAVTSPVSLDDEALQRVVKRICQALAFGSAPDDYWYIRFLAILRDELEKGKP